MIPFGNIEKIKERPLFYTLWFLSVVLALSSAAPDVSALCTGNVNGDEKVDLFDLVLVALSFDQSGTPGFVSADLNSDGAVNIFDFIRIALNFDWICTADGGSGTNPGWPHDLAYDILTTYCKTTFEESGTCPESQCEIGCGFDNSGFGGCPIVCNPKACDAFDSATCPLEVCQIMTDCNGNDNCYGQFTGVPPVCGVASYYGQDVACCTGLVKRCGRVFADGSCDSNLGRYDLPQCIPCGNGACDQFENKCSCPEDCQ